MYWHWCKCQNFILLWLNSIPSHTHTPPPPPPPHLIQSFVDVSLGCFQILAIVNSAVTTIGVHVSFQISAFSGYTPKSGIAGMYGNSIFNFWGTSILSSIPAAPNWIPTNSVVEFPHIFILVLLTLYYNYLFLSLSPPIDWFLWGPSIMLYLDTHDDHPRCVVTFWHLNSKCLEVFWVL